MIARITWKREEGGKHGRLCWYSSLDGLITRKAFWVKFQEEFLQGRMLSAVINSHGAKRNGSIWKGKLCS